MKAYTFPPTSPAPWATVVPGAGPTTADDLLVLVDDGHTYEVVDGTLVRMAGSGELATTIAGIIFAALFNFVHPRRLGVVTGADGVYAFPTAHTGLIPDVGFYIAARRAMITDRSKPIPFAPDLAVEVASPSQDRADMAAKAQRYLRGGTQLVWIVWPDDESIDIWTAQGHEPEQTLYAGDVLDGIYVIPGFTLSIADVFTDPLA